MSNTPGKDLLARFLERRERPDLHKHSIGHDRWDEEDLKYVIKEMRAFQQARRELGNFAPQSGETLMGDDFLALIKADPQVRDQAEMEPTHIINGVVMQEATELPEYEKVHRYTISDPIQAAASATSMKPKLEEIYDRMRTAQQHLQDLMDQMTEYAQLSEEAADLEEQMQGINDGSGEGGGDGQGNPQDQKSLIEEQMRRLEEQMQNTADAMDQEIENEIPHIQNLARQGMEQATEEAETTESAAAAWGLDPGGLKKLPPERRIELADKLNSEKFRKIAELFGPMQRLAMSEQERKVNYASDEIFDVEMGDDLERMLISESARLALSLIHISEPTRPY